MKTPQQILKEQSDTFDYWGGKDIWRQNLAIAAMKDYAREVVQSIIDKTMICDDNHNPVITKNELIEIKNRI